MGRRQKLWCVIESIEKSKVVTHGIGKKYLVHLVNGTKPVWVQSKDLSSGVCACYDETKTIPKKAKAKVDRGYVASAKSGHKLFESKSPQDPVKFAKRNSRWIIGVEKWISCTNKVCGCTQCLCWLFLQTHIMCLKQVLQTPLPKRKEALNQLIESMNPTQLILKLLQTERFLNNNLVAWESSEPVMQHVPSTGLIRCTVCCKDYSFTSQERCLIHLFSQKHHNHCKKKLQATVTTSSQNLMKESSANVVRGDEIISLIKNYASQYCVAKSLPFTAASMALDCACVALSTIATGGISPQSIAVLEKSGHKHEVFIFACVCIHCYNLTI